MATKDNSWLANNKQQQHSAVNNDYRVNNLGNQFSNLNLNQSQRSSYVLPVPSHNSSISSHGDKQHFGHSGISAVDTRYINPNLTNKTPFNGNSNALHQYNKPESKSDRSSSNIYYSNVNKSTLSQHISAYENYSNSFKSEENGAAKKEKDSKMNESKEKQDPFKWQRQQLKEAEEETAAAKAEIAKFKASQKLLKLKQDEISKLLSSAYSEYQQFSANQLSLPQSNESMASMAPMTPMAPMAPMAPIMGTEAAASQFYGDDLMEFNQKASKILDMISPNFVTIITFEQIFEHHYKMPISAILKEYCGKLADKEKFFNTISNIKIIQICRGYYISTTTATSNEIQSFVAENEAQRILSINEAMEIIVKKDKKDGSSSNAITDVNDLKKKFNYNRLIK